MAASSSSRDRTTGGGSNGANNGGSAGGSGSNGGSGRRDSGNNNSSSSSTDGRASTPLGWLKAIFTGSGSGSGSGSGNNPTVGSQSASTPTTPALAQNPNSSSHNPSVSIQPNQSNLTSPAASATVVRSGSRLGIASLNSSRANTPSPAPWSGPFSLSLSRNSNNNANNTNNHHRSRDNSVDRDTLDDRDRAASPMPRNHNNGKKDSAGGTSTIQVRYNVPYTQIIPHFRDWPTRKLDLHLLLFQALSKWRGTIRLLIIISNPITNLAVSCGSSVCISSAQCQLNAGCGTPCSTLGRPIGGTGCSGDLTSPSTNLKQHFPFTSHIFDVLIHKNTTSCTTNIGHCRSIPKANSHRCTSGNV
ncbi:hypothetical protein BC830DRAFT_565383 [Chytriomyces sp. MP71]|nr:hypothetical protein BC830DRAFT_565383 [Chytriomyces sp. MP71]